MIYNSLFSPVQKPSIQIGAKRVKVGFSLFLVFSFFFFHFKMQQNHWLRHYEGSKVGWEKKEKEERKIERRKREKKKKTPVARLEPKAAQNALTRYLSRDNTDQKKLFNFSSFFDTHNRKTNLTWHLRITESKIED